MKLTYGLVGKAAIRDNTTLFMYYGIKILPYNNYLVYLHCKNIQTYGFMTKVIHVHLFNGRKNYYFGSISAIYSVLTAEQVGMTKNTLLHAGLADGGHVMTKCALITQSHLIRNGQDGSNG